MNVLIRIVIGLTFITTISHAEAQDLGATSTVEIPGYNPSILQILQLKALHPLITIQSEGDECGIRKTDAELFTKPALDQFNIEVKNLDETNFVLHANLQALRVAGSDLCILTMSSALLVYTSHQAVMGGVDHEFSYLSDIYRSSPALLYTRTGMAGPDWMLLITDETTNLISNAREHLHKLVIKAIERSSGTNKQYWENLFAILPPISNRPD